MVKAYLIFVLIAMSAIIVASRWLPWWGALIVIPGSFLFFIWLAIALIKFGARNLLQSSLEDQSLVMQGATVTVLDVVACEAPEDPEAFDDPECAEEEDPDLMAALGRYVRVDLSVHPDPQSVANSRQKLEDDEGGTWMPYLFTLMEPGAVIHPKSQGVMAMFTIPQARVVKAEHVDVETTPAEEEDLTIEGPAQIQLTFLVPPELEGRVAVRYQLLELAEITLPPSEQTQRLT